MKRILLYLLLFVYCASVKAQDERFPLFTYGQSDGTEVQARCIANSRTNFVFYGTTDNVALVRNAKGDLCYARVEGEHLVPTDVLAHNPGQRSPEEAALAETTITTDEAFEHVKDRREIIPELGLPTNRLVSYDGDGMGKYGRNAGGAVASIGSFAIPVLLVEFPDRKFVSSNQQFDDMLNKEGYNFNGSKGSVAQFFKDQSFGLFTPTFEIVGRVTLPDSFAVYGHDNDDTKDPDFWYFVQTCFQVCKEQGISFRKFKNATNNNGVPLVALLYAGTGQATSGQADDLWPKEMDLGGWVEPGGVPINSIFCGNEMRGGVFSGMGTFVHEFGHALGLPDIYCTTYSHSKPLTGYWSTMESGCYESNGYRPMAYLAFERSYLGWMNIPEITEPHYITLYPYDDSRQPHAVLVRNDADSKEYFILEHRMPGTWSPDKYGSGMLITHVHYDKTAWGRNTVNNDADHTRFTVVPASGSLLAQASDLFNQSTRNSFTDTSNPSPKLFTGEKLGKPIYNIKFNNDSKTVKFAYLNTQVPEYYDGDTVLLASYKVYCRVEPNLRLTVVPSPYSQYTGRITLPNDSIFFDRRRFKVTSIESRAFRDCPSLRAVVLGNRVESIGEGAFNNTPALEELVISSKGSSYFDASEGGLFSKRLANEVIGQQDTLPFYINGDDAAELVEECLGTDEAGVTSYLYRENGLKVLMTEATNTESFLWLASSGITRFRMRRDNTMTIAAPSGCEITKVEFNATTFNITAEEGTLDNKVWQGNAETVTFTSTGSSYISSFVVYVERKRLSDIHFVQAPQAITGKYVVPEGVQIVDMGAFKDAKYDVVELPSTLVALHTDALNTASLDTIIVHAAVPVTVDETVFAQVDKANCVLVVPEDVQEAYQNAPIWKDFVKRETTKPTGIHLNVVLGEKLNDEIYDLQGRRLPVIRQKGIYIIGGRKVHVR